jgi:putative hydrolase of the HAD superfamily
MDYLCFAMMPKFLPMDNNQCWVFDLDDTLYLEQDYVKSAHRFISELVKKNFGNTEFAHFLSLLNKKKQVDPISKAWLQSGLPQDELAGAIVSMRAHRPNIALSSGAKLVLDCLRKESSPYGIITDGRSVTQREKIAALECNDAAFISISEEVSYSKLDPERFIAITSILNASHYVYVGDNPAKDFFIPRQLGWKTIMINNLDLSIHSQILPEDVRYHPDETVNDLSSLLFERENYASC